MRGLAHLTTVDDGPGVAALVRLGPLDMFRFGHREAVDAAYRLASGTDSVAGFVDIDLSLFTDALAAEPLLSEVTLVRSDLAQLPLPPLGADRPAFVARLSMLLAGHGFAATDPGTAPRSTSGRPRADPAAGRAEPSRSTSPDPQALMDVT